MCIRDSFNNFLLAISQILIVLSADAEAMRWLFILLLVYSGCLLYTSDAADERSSVDLGGRRIIKKKNNVHVVDSTDYITKLHSEDNNKRSQQTTQIEQNKTQ